MEVFNPSIPIRPKVFSNCSIFLPNSSIKVRSKENVHKFRVWSSKINRIPSFSIYLPISKKNIQISAQFGRPAPRRNSLRKKLIEDKQVREDPITFNPSYPDHSYHSSIEIVDRDVLENSSVEELKPKQLGESVLLNKLENWIDMYKKDAEYWGIGSSPIFTIFEDSNGNVDRVSVDEDEILRRNKIQLGEFSDLAEVNTKILRAKSLAREMESGSNVIPRNSSVAKFVLSGGESSFVQRIQAFAFQPDLLPKLSRVGSTILCSFILLFFVKKLFSFKNNEIKYTELEKEMMRRKIKSRKEREMLEKSSVEVVQESPELPVVFTEKPKLDKQELMDSILKAKVSKKNLALQDYSTSPTAVSMSFDDKIEEIREMARQAREHERGEHSLINGDEEKKQAMSEVLYNENKANGKEDASILTKVPSGDPGQARDIDGTRGMASMNEPKVDDTESFSNVVSQHNRDMQVSSSSSMEVLDDRQTVTHEKDNEGRLHLADTREVSQSPDAPDSEPKSSSIRSKPRVIRSVKEAKEYLSKKREKQEPSNVPKVKVVQKTAASFGQTNNTGLGNNVSQRLKVGNNGLEHATFRGTSDSMSTYGDSSLKDKESTPIKNDDCKASELGSSVGDLQKPQTSVNHISNSNISDTGSTKIGNWLEENFNVVEPIVKKIRTGYRDNYTVAREKVNQQLDIKTDITQFSSDGDDGELEWMEDDGLKEIVFQVRENEIAGRDPFHMMDAEDKLAFFSGLEKKVEKENEKLSKLHEWLHSNIENLDYGADGISLYDPPEKVIPRWKGPSLEKSPEFLNNFLEERNTFFAENSGISYPVKKDEQSFNQIATESPVRDNIAPSSAAYDPEKKFHDGEPKNSKTFIEGSDGSVRAGKVSGKEFWQHTKKWSRGFLESYNAEADPEIKSVMKDIGKDLDRWITEKEVQEAADLVNKIPERNKKFMEKKLEKLKREMELFGPQAVVSKYREYAEDKEEDYLWWLDLPFVMCIELYTTDNGEQKIGFYSLEMAADLELEPKPCHVIAFENLSSCKNLCYIIQAHMDMIGNGYAFVVPRPPKDAFREAKENGFGVTVIREGELQLNIDQTLEEVEEQITEIGSKIYHNMIMKERSVDISSLMKGVFGSSSKPTRRRKPKRRVKKPSKK